jgi:PAS domain S-box-containing protein
MTLRLTSRIVLIFVFFAAALVVTIGVFAYRSGSESLEAAAVSEMLALATEKEAALDTWIEERLGDLRQLATERDLVEKTATLVAAAPASRDARSARALVLQELEPHMSTPRSRFLELFVIEPNGGTVLASTTPAEEGKSKIGHLYFDRGKTDVYLQGPYYSVDVKAPVLTAAMPLRSADGRVLAVLAARVNLETMNAIVQRREGRHQTEDAFLFNSERLLVTQPRFISDAAVLQRKLDSEPVTRCITGREPAVVASDYRRVPAVTACRWNAKYQLGLIVTIDQDEAFAPVRRFGRSMVQVGSLAMLVSAGLALMLARTITRPLRVLHDSVRHFAEGQFKEPIPESSGDELGLLACEFNGMALAIGRKEAELRQLTVELDGKIQQRTAELTRSEARLMQAQELAQAGSWEWDVVGNTVTWSDESFRIFGFAPGGCTPSYEQYLACIHPDDRPRTAEWINSVLATKASSSLDNRIVRPDGEVRVVHGRSDVVLDDAGRVVRVFGTIQDITERKQREDKLHLFRSLLDQSTDSVLVTDPATARITDASGSACLSLGYTREEMLALRVPDIEATFSSFEEFEQNLRRLKAAGALRFEGRQRRKDGSTFPVEVSVSYVARPEGDYVLTIARDVTERNRAQEELQQAKEGAEAANRAKSEFLATMSHEIRTPMNGVVGAVGLLLDGDLTPRQHELATIAQSSAHSLLTLINDILDISKIEAGKMPIEQAPFDLLTTVEDVGEMFAERAEEKRVELVLRYAPDARRRFVGDAGRIRQVLVNLVGNAIKFSERGHVLVSIEEERSAERQPLAMLRFAIEDTGVGISPEAMDRLFERFAQVDASTTRRFGGTGLGLAICKRLVEMMGGQIGVTSRGGEGSTFWFTLPLLMDASPAPAPAPMAADLTAARVLLVDNHPVNGRVITEQMSGWNIRNTVAASAREALAVLRAAVAAGDPYHIALIDYRMPDMDGVGLAKVINADPTLRDMALILQISTREKNSEELSREGGFASWLVKPVRPSALFDGLIAACAARAGGLDARTAARHAADGPIAAPARPRFRGRVLVADDNTTNQRVAQLALEGLGCSVALARNGAEVLVMLQQRPYDLVFMDCEMPEVDGFEATREIRASEARLARGGSPAPHGRMPVVAMTAKALSGDREKCLAAGMDDYLGKPVQLGALIETLERWLPVEARPGAGEPSTQTTPRAQRPDTPRAVAPSGALDQAALDRLRELAQATTPALFAQVLEAFRTDAATYLVALQDAATRNDRVRLARTAHALKGASLSVGATTMAQVSRQLEAIDEADELTAVPSLLAQLESAFQRVKTEIERELGPGTGQ